MSNCCLTVARCCCLHFPNCVTPLWPRPFPCTEQNLQTVNILLIFFHLPLALNGFYLLQLFLAHGPCPPPAPRFLAPLCCHSCYVLQYSIFTSFSIFSFSEERGSYLPNTFIRFHSRFHVFFPLLLRFFIVASSCL